MTLKTRNSGNGETLCFPITSQINFSLSSMHLVKTWHLKCGRNWSYNSENVDCKEQRGTQVALFTSLSNSPVYNMATVLFAKPLASIITTPCSDHDHDAFVTHVAQ